MFYIVEPHCGTFNLLGVNTNAGSHPSITSIPDGGGEWNLVCRGIWDYIGVFWERDNMGYAPNNPIIIRGRSLTQQCKVAMNMQGGCPTALAVGDYFISRRTVMHSHTAKVAGHPCVSKRPTRPGIYAGLKG